MARLVRWFHKGTTGHSWYANARKECGRLAVAYGVSPRAAAGVVAALSPRMRWSVNLRQASRVLAAHASGEVAPPHVGIRAFVAKAWRIAKGERPLDVLSGPKVRAFYRNLCGDLSHVTVDVWAARALGWNGDKGMTDAQYARASEAYRRAAASVGVPPAVFQAVVWAAIRGRAV
jgi:hypothetical protein